MITARTADLIDKMNSSDKDFRFMAVNDLIENIKNKSIVMDDQTEKTVIETLLKMLNDPNAEVQNLVVRCLGLCASIVNENRLKNLIDALCKAMDNDNENVRDASSMAIGHAIKEYQNVNFSFQSLTSHVLPKFIGILKNNKDVNVVDRVLEILAEIFCRSRDKTDWKVDDLTNVMFLHAESDRIGIRKRAQNAISLYADVIDNKLYNNVLNIVYEACKKYQDDNGRLRTYIATASAICKNSGSRFSEKLSEFVELFIQICEHNADDEVREIAINAFEIFYQKCPEAVDKYNKEIIKIVVDLIGYDPNYSYDDSDNEDAMDVDYENGIESDEDVSDYSDDEDVSWKVRRASAKCIRAIIASRTDRLYDNYVTFGLLLIKRLKEREDNVKQEIINAYMSLLEQTRVLIPENIVPYTFNDLYYDNEKYLFDNFTKFINDEHNPARKQVFDELNNQISLLVKRICIVQKTKDMRIIVQTFVLLTTLLRAYPGCIGTYLSQLTKGIKLTLTDRDGNLKTSTLRFLSMFFATHNYQEYGQDILPIFEDITRLASDSFSKVASESIDVINFLTRSMVESNNPDLDIINKIYDLLVKKLQISDMDQEVKDRTIMGIAYFISGFGDKIGSTLDSTLHLLSSKLNNEMSRNVTLRALTIIAKSNNNYSIKSIISEVVQYFSTFLRQNNRTLRIYTFNLALALLEREKDGGLSGINVSELVNGIPTLLKDSDLQIAQLALNVMIKLLLTNSTNIGDITPVIDESINLSKSSSVQGGSQKALYEFFSALIKSNVCKDIGVIVAKFMSIVTSNDNLYKNAYNTISKCIAYVALATGNISTSIELSNELEKCVTHGQTESISQLGVLTIGELGRVFPDVYTQSSSIDPAKLIIDCFGSNSSEDVKMMASQALGSLAVGNIQRFLPFILNQIEGQPTRQYLLIYALKELITSETVNDEGQQLFTQKMDSIWDVLVKHAGSSEESTHVIVAECLGKLSLMNSKKYLKSLLELFESKESRIRSTVLVAVRYMIQDQPNPADEYLSEALIPFLQKGIKDVDIETRRLAIVLLNTVVHHKPHLVYNILERLLPSVYLETEVRKELQHEVSMGPFKHLVDNGLELRKSAFECLYSLVEHCLGHLKLNEFITRIENGLMDNHDIKQLSYLTIIRLTEICPFQLVQHVDKIADIMKIHLQTKPKQNAVKLENDKQEEMKRSVIKTLLAIKNMQVHERFNKIKEVYDMVSTEEFSAILNEVRNEINTR